MASSLRARDLNGFREEKAFWVSCRATLRDFSKPRMAG